MPQPPCSAVTPQCGEGSHHAKLPKCPGAFTAGRTFYVTNSRLSRRTLARNSGHSQPRDQDPGRGCRSSSKASSRWICAHLVHFIRTFDLLPLSGMKTLQTVVALARIRTIVLLACSCSTHACLSPGPAFISLIPEAARAVICWLRAQHRRRSSRQVAHT